jgi:hypothetical protein
MKDNDFELALKRFEYSESNDELTYEKHYYNGFSGMESEEAYHKHLQALYDNYIFELNKKIEAQTFTNPAALSTYIHSKLILFTKIKTEWDNNYIIDTWNSTIQATYSYYMNSKYARNELGTLQFFVKCVGSQYYFIDEIIKDITELCNLYNPQQSQSTINKPKQATVKNFTDYLHHNNKDALMVKLHELLDGVKGKNVAIVIKALINLHFLVGHQSYHILYDAMRKEFGNIGTDQSINDFLNTNKNNITDSDLNHYIEILKAIE